MKSISKEKMRIKIKVSAAALLAVCLAGCSSEPLAGDIDAAVRKSADDANKAAIEIAIAFAGA